MSSGAKGIGAVLIACALLLPAGAAFAQTSSLTVAPAAPQSANNCFPFGSGNNAIDDWRPYMGFVYKNVPAFALHQGASERVLRGPDSSTGLGVSLSKNLWMSLVHPHDSRTARAVEASGWGCR